MFPGNNMFSPRDEPNRSFTPSNSSALAKSKSLSRDFKSVAASGTSGTPSAGDNGASSVKPISTLSTANIGYTRPLTGTGTTTAANPNPSNVTSPTTPSQQSQPSSAVSSGSPFSDLKLPSFRPDLGRMGRKISEFGKEVFALEEEPPVRSRTPVPGTGSGAGAVSGAGAGGGRAAALGATTTLTAPPLTRAGTAPIIPITTPTRAAAPGPVPATTSTRHAHFPEDGSSPIYKARQAQQHRPSTPLPEDVPGMGDEPVLCPFCEKPLPPSLIISQMAHVHAARERGKRASEDSPSSGLSALGSLSGLRRSLGELVGDGEGVILGNAAMAAVGSQTPRGSGQGSQLAPGGSVSKGASVVNSKKEAEGKGKVEKISAESLLPIVKSSESADTNAAASLISTDQVAEWTRRAGLSVDEIKTTGKDVSDSKSTIVPASSTALSGVSDEDDKTPVPFPLLPPPPPPAERMIVHPAQKSQKEKAAGIGGIFRRGSKAVDGDDEESEDEGYAAGGYAKLTGPASPDREEPEKEWPVREKKGEKEIVTGDMEEKGDGKVAGRSDADDETRIGVNKTDGSSDVNPSVQGHAPSGSATTETVTTGADAETRKILAEVLGKLNAMAESHSELVLSHASLLTSLKIARSNLVMAEANAEMLEDQLKRAQEVSKAAIAPAVKAAAPRSTSASTSMPPPSVPPARSTQPSSTSYTEIKQPVPVRKSLEDPRSIAIPPRSNVNQTKPRPSSLVIPASSLFETGPQTGPATSNPSAEGRGMFGGFFGTSKKLPGGLGSINIPSTKELSASAAKWGDTLAGPSRPMTPTGSYNGAPSASSHATASAVAGQASATSPGQFFDFHVPSPPPQVSGDGRSPGTGAGTGATLSPGVIPPRPISPGGGATPRPPAAASSQNQVQIQNQAEMAKLRAAYHLTQTKMDLMARELGDLKKGKIEMEAELETLSQALFEEANKMVADERRRRLEVEETLKEVREEREALRETIKVLGGGAEGVGVGVGKSDGEEEKGESGKAEGEGKDKDAGDGGDKEEEGDDWKPRDLDKHYEALRKTIHHVADGAGGAGGGGGEALAAAVRGMDVDANVNASSFADGSNPSLGLTLDGVGAEARDGFIPVTVNPILELSPILPKTMGGQEVNPWAEVDFGGGGGDGTGVRKTYDQMSVGGVAGFGVDPLDDGQVGLGGAGNGNGNTGAGVDVESMDMEDASGRDEGRMRRSSTT